MLLMQLDMPSARYVCHANEGFISYRIDVRKANGNISSLSVAKAYRVNEVDISTEEKMRARVQGENPYILALFLFVYGFGLSPFRICQDRCDARA